MDDMRLKLYSPVVTGNPGVIPQVPKTPSKSGEDNNVSSFGNILRRNLEKSSDVEFSKHAIKRAIDHDIELDDEAIQKLNEGVRLATERNLNDTLILVGDTAFVVNIKNNKVITALGRNTIAGNVFTNIDGAVIV